VVGALFKSTRYRSRCNRTVIAKHSELMSICPAHYWKREIYPLEKEKCLNIPTGEAELTPNCSRSAKRSNALLLKLVVVTYESDLGKNEAEMGGAIY